MDVSDDYISSVEHETYFVRIDGVVFVDLFRVKFYEQLLNCRSFELLYHAKKEDPCKSDCSFVFHFDCLAFAHAAYAELKDLFSSERILHINTPRVKLKHCSDICSCNQPSCSSVTCDDEDGVDVDQIEDDVESVVEYLIAQAERAVWPPDRAVYSREDMLGCCPTRQIPMPQVRRVHVPDKRFHRTVVQPLQTVMQNVTQVVGKRLLKCDYLVVDDEPTTTTIVDAPTTTIVDAPGGGDLKPSDFVLSSPVQSESTDFANQYGHASVSSSLRENENSLNLRHQIQQDHFVAPPGATMITADEWDSISNSGFVGAPAVAGNALDAAGDRLVNGHCGYLASQINPFEIYANVSCADGAKKPVRTDESSDFGMSNLKLQGGNGDFSASPSISPSDLICNDDFVTNSGTTINSVVVTNCDNRESNKTNLWGSTFVPPQTASDLSSTIPFVVKLDKDGAFEGLTSSPSSSVVSGGNTDEGPGYPDQKLRPGYRNEKQKPATRGIRQHKRAFGLGRTRSTIRISPTDEDVRPGGLAVGHRIRDGSTTHSSASKEDYVNSVPDVLSNSLLKMNPNASEFTPKKNLKKIITQGPLQGSLNSVATLPVKKQESSIVSKDETLWKIDKEPAFRIFSPSREDNWFYMDPNEEIQGPFPSHYMFAWMEHGFFTDATLVKRVQDEDFSKIGDYKKLYGTVPFLAT